MSSKQKLSGKSTNCPYTRTISLIGSEWNLMIIKELYLQKKLNNRPYLRFNELLKHLSPISSKTLTTKLKELQKIDIIERKVTATTPVLITYSLTEKGFDLNDILEAMAQWSLKWNMKER